MNRRDFIAGLTLSASGFLVRPLIPGARAADDGPIVAGNGSRTFQLVESWGPLPDGIRYGYTHGVVVDFEDNVYIHNQSRDAVVAFDREGNFLRSWGEEFASGAHGMYLNRESGQEYLYLSDYVRHTVVKTTLEGDVVWRLGVPPRPDLYESEAKYRPTDVAVAPDGRFYVCDGYGESWVHLYSPDAEYVRSWGGKGSEIGKLNTPHGIWVDTRSDDPVVRVADRSNHRIHAFSLDGEPMDIVDDDLRLPCCFYQFGGDMFVPDLHGRVTILDSENHVAAHLGDNPGVWDQSGWPNLLPETRVLGKFISPHAACVDSRGDLYVVEWVSDGRASKWQRIP
ncbi:hypothetical protein FJZ36_06135 [Candidatus Poribacteria bacterium]|nr:hypothetical protein [Candidatus Poribacteria bacterium]